MTQDMNPENSINTKTLEPLHIRAMKFAQCMSSQAFFCGHKIARARNEAEAEKLYTECYLSFALKKYIELIHPELECENPDEQIFIVEEEYLAVAHDLLIVAMRNIFSHCAGKGGIGIEEQERIIRVLVKRSFVAEPSF